MDQQHPRSGPSRSMAKHSQNYRANMYEQIVHYFTQVVRLTQYGFAQEASMLYMVMRISLKPGLISFGCFCIEHYI